MILQTPVEQSLRLTETGRTRGRALLLGEDGALYIGRNYSIFRSRDAGRSWQFIAKIPTSLARRVVRFSRMACRLLRHEVRALKVLSDGSLLASNRQYIYYAASGDKVMTRARLDEGSQSLAPPMIITVGPQERILWGEYDSETFHGRPVRLYVSEDKGRSYEIARVFPGGEIEHVHNLIFDPKLDKYWLLAGDHGQEPGIGLLSRDLSDFEWVAKGKQMYRAVEAFDFGDCLIYATDTEQEQNALYRLDKATARFTKLREFEGSCIYACRFGGFYAISTTVELTTVNMSRRAGLLLSRDGEDWHQVFHAEKDRWPLILFQFGSLILPRGKSPNETILFSGQAVNGLDGRVVVGRCQSEP